MLNLISKLVSVTNQSFITVFTYFETLFVLWRMKRRSRNMATMPNESEINALLVKPATRNVKNDTEAAVSAYGN